MALGSNAKDAIGRMLREARNLQMELEIPRAVQGATYHY